jgi:NADH-quinone oxidoreductase subunit A
MLPMTPLLAAYSSYFPIIILLLIGIGFGVINLILPKFFAWVTRTHARSGPIKSMTYESGMDPIGTARKRFNIRFYILAMTFLVFDVEIVFLYPWAVNFSSLEMGGPLSTQFLIRMLFFVGTSMVAYLYAWKKGVFRYD